MQLLESMKKLKNETDRAVYSVNKFKKALHDIEIRERKLRNKKK